MSYEIYYDRAFIRVDDRFVPLVNQGSNNCWEYKFFSKREVPEKNWQVLNWRNRSQLLYTEAEVHEIAKDYDEISRDSGTCFKSRNRQFEPGEFERWILCGLKSAFTIEEYVSFGNSIKINDYSADDTKDWKLHPFSTTEEFLALLDSLKEQPLLNIHFENNREVYRPKKHRSSPKMGGGRPGEYFVLSTGKSYFCKLTRYGYRITNQVQGKYVRIFEKEQAAQKYLEKYAERFKHSFEVEKIISA